MKALVIAVVVIATVFLALQVWRWSDKRHADRVWNALRQQARSSVDVFDESIVEDLPEPARRYFLYTIRAGTALRTVAEVSTNGEFGLGTKDRPNYLAMRAEQILAPPYGFVWKSDAGSGVMRISGSDGYDGETSWVRFWLMKTVPVVRSGGTADHAHSAFGRVVAEAVFWAPAALLPQHGVTWEATGSDVARASVTHNGISQAVDITIAKNGQPKMVIIQRWSDANDDKTYRLQPFGGYLSEFRDFDGYRLPTRVEGGNFIGTKDYFPFYKARVDEIRFIDTASGGEP